MIYPMMVKYLIERIQEAVNVLIEPHTINKVYNEFMIRVEMYVGVEDSLRKNVRLQIFMKKIIIRFYFRLETDSFHTNDVYINK